MGHGRRLTITIEPAGDGYVARLQSPFLKAIFSVEVGDNIFGAVALHDFTEMLRGQFGSILSTP